MKIEMKTGTKAAGGGTKGKKGQLLSFDFLISAAILAIALGVFLNSYSQLQKNSVGRIENASAFAISQNYYEKLVAGEIPAGCTSMPGGEMVCNACPAVPSPDGGKYFERRLYASSSNQVFLLKTGVCS